MAPDGASGIGLLESISTTTTMPKEDASSATIMRALQRMNYRLGRMDDDGPEIIEAAGILFNCKGKVLFVKRGPGSDYPGMWAIPGGRCEGSETLEECAERETREEIGPTAYGALRYHTRRIAPRDTVGPLPTPAPGEAVPPLPPPAGPLVDFTTFIADVREEFIPKLNDEHTAYSWADVATPPEPLHPGIIVSLAKLNATETDIAHLIQAGELTSPQRFENVTLFAVRVTGTGTAYRTSLDEHVYRPPEHYLNPEFLERCNGLPVVWLHPPDGSLDTKEFIKRIVGTITLPYIQGEEVWGIAKIWDDNAAREMESKQLSTSPAVVFKPTDGNTTLELANGKTILIEGKPSLLDHLAICEEGVWDKGGPPVGVVTNPNGESVMAEDTRRDDDAHKRLDAVESKMDEGFDKLLKCVDSIARRMDDDDARRKDDDDRKRRDDAMAACDAFKFSHRKDDDDDDSYRKRHDAEEEEVRRDMEEAGHPKELAADKAKHRRDESEKEEEEEEKEKKDAKRKDDAEEEEEKEKMEKDAKKRHDDDDDDRKRKDDDRKRRDDDRRRKDDDDRKRRDDARADSELKALRDQVSKLPKPSTDKDYEAMAAVQARADSVYQEWGSRAAPPMVGEEPRAYRIRLANGIKHHSNPWKEVVLSDLPENALKIAEEAIYADASAAAHRAEAAPEGMLREIRSVDETGRTIRSFVGEPNVWMQAHRTIPRSLTRPFFNPRRQA